MDLISQLCTYDPDVRLTAKQALRHPYFRDLRFVLSEGQGTRISSPLQLSYNYMKNPGMLASVCFFSLNGTMSVI